MVKKREFGLNDMVKNLDIWDIALVKFSVFFFMLAVIAFYPPIVYLVIEVNPWIYAVLFILAAARPFRRLWK